MKEQLESVVLQMYKAGVGCSEAVREFQRNFILTVLKDQRGNQCKAAETLGIHRNTLRRTIRELEIDIGPTRAMGRWPPAKRDVAPEERNPPPPATSIGSPMRCSAAMRSITSERNSGSARQ